MKNKIEVFKVNLFVVFIKMIKEMKKKAPFYILAILGTTIGLSSFGVIMSLFLKEVVDIAVTGDLSMIWLVLMKNIVLAICALLLWRYSTIYYNVEAKRAIANIEKQAYVKAMKLPISYYEEHHSAEFISHLIFDVKRAGDLYGSKLRRTIDPLVAVFIYTIPMLLINWQITLLLIITNLILLLINFIFVPIVKKNGYKLSLSNSKYTKNLSNEINGIEIIKMFLGTKNIKIDYEKSNFELKKVNEKNNLILAFLDSINSGFNLICSLLFLLIGAYFVSNNMIEVSGVTAIYAMYTGFSQKFMMIGKSIPELVSSLVSGRIIYDFLQEKEAIEKENKSYLVDRKKGTSYIQMEHIYFNYGEKEVLKDFNMKIDEGNSVAIVSPSGSGKTTIVKLLLGFYRASSGKIIVGGQELNDDNVLNIRKKIAYVPQEPYLYNVSIKENIMYGNLNATEDEIVLAAKLANIHDFIIGLKDGYNTMVVGNGKNMSGGEKQRIAIARAVLKNAPILLLDEATSALDNESEELVQKAINNVMKGKTTIMIAHKPQTIASADFIINI